MTIRPIDLDIFTKNGRNVHEAIVACSKRARMVNDDIKIEFNQRIEAFQPRLETESEEGSDVNPDQLRVSVEFERRAKPTEVALRELSGGDLGWTYREREEPVVPEKEETPEPDESEEAV